MNDKTIKGIYLIWVTIHLFVLLLFSDGIFNRYNRGGDRFFPFNGIHKNPDTIMIDTWNQDWENDSTLTKFEKNLKRLERISTVPNPEAGYYFEFKDSIVDYDITEFLFYLIAPVLLYFSYQFIRPKSGENK